jgi:hypothetical protein
VSKGQLTIAILQRGWVKIGYLTRDADMMLMRESRTITTWGTAGGLGLEHLAEVGPTSATKWSAAKADGRHHLLSAIDWLACTDAAVKAWEAAWK